MDEWAIELTYRKVNEAFEILTNDPAYVLDSVISGMKILALAFILLNILKGYVESLNSAINDQKPSVDFSEIIKSLFYIALVFNYDLIIDTIDTGIASYADSFIFDNKSSIYSGFKETFSTIQNDNGVTNQDAVNGIAYWVEYIGLIMQDPFFIILEILKCVAWLVSLFIFPSFYIERGFILMFMKLIFPLILALGAFKAYNDLVLNWIKLYCAVFLTGLGFLVADWVCDSLYTILIAPTAAMNKLPFVTGGAFVYIIVFVVIIISKIRLYRACLTYSYKIFKV